jgi:3-methyladenine DNA glycosylase AlkD
MLKTLSSFDLFNLFLKLPDKILLMHPYIIPVARAFKKIADTENAINMKAYMRNQYAFLGIKTPDRRKICKSHMKNMPMLEEKELFIVVKELWNLPEREYQYFGQELIGYHKKKWTRKIIALLEYCITHKSWWDTVDALSTEGTGPYFQMFPEEIKIITNRWNLATDIWLNRSSLLFQKNYKGKTDKDLLSAYILQLSGSGEFFIQKAIGWMLREYAKTNPGWVKEFVGKNKLAPLSKREALKNL